VNYLEGDFKYSNLLIDGPKANSVKNDQGVGLLLIANSIPKETPFFALANWRK